jgi:hypothetical protein
MNNQTPSASPASSAIQSDPEAVTGTAHIAANSSAKGVPLSPKIVTASAGDDIVNPYIELESPAVPTPPATGVFFICRVYFETTQPDTAFQVSGECKILQESPVVSSQLIIGTLDNRSEDDEAAVSVPRGQSTSYEINVAAPGEHFIEFNFVNDDAGAAVPMTQCFCGCGNSDPCKPSIITRTETRTGTVVQSQTDLSANAFGIPLVVSREYSNKLSETTRKARAKVGSSVGNRLFPAQPHLVFSGGNSILVSRGARDTLRFDRASSGEWVPRHGMPYSLEEIGNGYLLSGKNGGAVSRFYGTGPLKGALQSMTASNRNIVAYYVYDQTRSITIGKEGLTRGTLSNPTFNSAGCTIGLIHNGEEADRVLSPVQNRNAI